MFVGESYFISVPAFADLDVYDTFTFEIIGDQAGFITNDDENKVIYIDPT